MGTYDIRHALDRLVNADDPEPLAQVLFDMEADRRNLWNEFAELRRFVSGVGNDVVGRLEALETKGSGQESSTEDTPNLLQQNGALIRDNAVLRNQLAEERAEVLRLKTMLTNLEDLRTNLSNAYMALQERLRTVGNDRDRAYEALDTIERLVGEQLQWGKEGIA